MQVKMINLGIKGLKQHEKYVYSETYFPVSVYLYIEESVHQNPS